MSGQSANLTIKEAVAMQKRTQCSGSQSDSGKKSSGGKMKHEEMKKGK